MTTFSILLLFTLCSPVGQAVSVPDFSEALQGEWRVDLRQSPDAAPYFQVLELKVNKRGELSGHFYGSKFKKGVINGAWTQLYFAFRTQDRNNTYFHTGYLDGETLRGQTYCPERSFIAPWVATRLTETIEK